MSLAEGTKLGTYEVIGAIGAGGMGEVYRARDTRLGRAVALKVLPEAFRFDPDRVSRFEREAKLLASLNHPHIAALYGAEEADGRHFLVMELVQGDTLADWIRRGPIPLEDALKLAVQIAEALEAAHENGVVHRDLKPANVKVTPEGRVKVLDFGLAKALEPLSREGEQTDPAKSPTMSLAATQAGIILGTAAYMSPEQAKGLPADHRSDVFSFGVVFCEMLTGRQTFQGDTISEVLASVLVREPDLNALPPGVNPRLPELLRRCLEKNPRRRWQAIGDVRAELEAVVTAPRAVPLAPQPVAASRPLWKRAIPMAVTALLATTLTAIVMSNLGSPTASTVTRFRFELPEDQIFTALNRRMLDISPDGTLVVYFANSRLFLRPLSEIGARPIPGTEQFLGNTTLAFSPDGRSIVFWSTADRALKRIAVTGGAAVTIAAATVAPFGIDWHDGTIWFGAASGIFRVSANGGEPEGVIKVEQGEFAYGPQLLPGGEFVLFTVAAGTAADRWDRARIVVQSLKTGERTTLIQGGSDARYVPTGHIVYALGGNVLAVPFDLDRLVVTGGPVPIVEGVRRTAVAGVAGSAQFSLSDTGSLAYVPGPISAGSLVRSDLAWMGRQGGVEPLNLVPRGYEYPRVSPDGTRIAVGSLEGDEAIVWIYDVSGASALRRLTFGGNGRFPVWSADSRRVAFQSDREGDLAIFWQSADGTGTAERLTKAEQGVSHVPESWSPDGETLLFNVTEGSTVALWMLSLTDKSTVPFDAVQSSEPTTAVFSPDGGWVAYASTEGRAVATIFVQPFPPTGAKYEIPSTGTGGPHHPRWSPDGKELFYIPSQGAFATVGVSTQPTFTFGNPQPVPRAFGPAPPTTPRTWDIAPDGRILGVVLAGETSGAPTLINEIEVVLNWFEELKARVQSP